MLHPHDCQDGGFGMPTPLQYIALYYMPVYYTAQMSHYDTLGSPCYVIL